LIGQPVTIIAGDQHWAVSEHQLAAALRLPEDTVNGIPTIDPDALLPDLTQIQEELGQSPKDAVVGWDNGLYVLEDGTDGVEVDLASLSEAIAAAATTEQRTVEVSLLPIKPTVHRGNLDTLGITTRLGTGSSSFAGSDDARAENLRVGAFWVDQTLIPPRSSFSFNEALGPISLDRGYVEGKIIADNWYESDIGGGVCQVSTTVFRAALYAGLEFQEWHPHSFRLGFYELEDWPPGMDAAIYVPNTPDETELDLVFANPTDSWLLLQLGINGDRLTAEIIGPNTGYDVEIAAPQVSDPIAPPAPEERVDPDLAAGDRVMAQTEKPGYEVTMRRVVKLGADTIADNTFYSYYFPQPEVWQVSPANA
jgi:vancomycin resistance protein YoaR